MTTQKKKWKGRLWHIGAFDNFDHWYCNRKPERVDNVVPEYLLYAAIPEYGLDPTGICQFCWRNWHQVWQKRIQAALDGAATPAGQYWHIGHHGSWRVPWCHYTGGPTMMAKLGWVIPDHVMFATVNNVGRYGLDPKGFCPTCWFIWDRQRIMARRFRIQRAITPPAQWKQNRRGGYWRRYKEYDLGINPKHRGNWRGIIYHKKVLIRGRKSYGANLQDAMSAMESDVDLLVLSTS